MSVNEVTISKTKKRETHRRADTQLFGAHGRRSRRHFSLLRFASNMPYSAS